MRPNIGALLFGIILGWTGGIRWIERTLWVTAAVGTYFLGKQ